MNLLQKAITELQLRKGDWVLIANQANVSYSWITKFANNKIPNAGVITVERILEILNKDKK